VKKSCAQRMQGHGCARVGAARVLQPHPSACTYHSAAAGAAIAPAARTPAPADTRQHHPSPARVCTAPSTASNVCCPRRSARPSSAAEKAPTRSSGRPWPMRSHAPIMRSTPRHPIKPATTRARTTHAHARRRCVVHKSRDTASKALVPRAQPAREAIAAARRAVSSSWGEGDQRLRVDPRASRLLLRCHRMPHPAAAAPSRACPACRAPPPRARASSEAPSWHPTARAATGSTR